MRLSERSGKTGQSEKSIGLSVAHHCRSSLLKIAPVSFLPVWCGVERGVAVHHQWPGARHATHTDPHRCYKQDFANSDNLFMLQN
ncbi:hypothetical protein E2C01_058259 [Portunus trituberculatus]|uniref:Uncharacterized protein n=1 Tax=Portunus trituberculatus TaxID=210409 RepID=A0A5B7H474_PORTR|nr:hypothetical protein [Portunus trituberculatus]